MSTKTDDNQERQSGISYEVTPHMHDGLVSRSSLVWTFARRYSEHVTVHDAVRHVLRGLGYDKAPSNVLSSLLCSVAEQVIRNLPLQLSDDALQRRCMADERLLDTESLVELHAWLSEWEEDAPSRLDVFRFFYGGVMPTHGHEVLQGHTDDLEDELVERGLLRHHDHGTMHIDTRHTEIGLQLAEHLEHELTDNE